MKLGKWIQSKGGIPTSGSDQYIMSTVFVAGEKPVIITAGSYWSGDASETYRLSIIPPSGSVVWAENTYDMTDFNGALAFGGQYGGNKGTILDPSSIFWSSDSAQTFGWIVPPYWRVVVYNTTGASSTDFGMRLGGFEIEDY